MTSRNDNTNTAVLIWDLPTRLFHWALVLSVSGAFVSQWFYQSIPFWVHRACGIAALVLILFRVIWGFVGTRHARFADFIRGPRAVRSYLAAVLRRDTPPMPRHTPAGGWMIVVLLALVAVQAGLGLYSNDETDAAGPLVGWVSHHVSNALTGWHHRVGTALWIAIAGHVLAVAYYRLVLRENLVRSLLNGRRAGVAAAEGIASHQGWRAVIILALCACALAVVFALAPPVPDLLM